MLSKENSEKLVQGGVYGCEPKASYRGRVFSGNLYHCCNWVFDVVQSGDKYYMVDTYWSSGDKVKIEVTDENVNEFELLFKRGEIKEIKESEKDQYEDYYRVALDSGGWSYPRYLVKKDAVKSMDKVIEVLDDKIEAMERQLSNLKERRASILDGSYPFHLV